MRSFVWVLIGVGVDLRCLRFKVFGTLFCCSACVCCGLVILVLFVVFDDVTSVV